MYNLTPSARGEIFNPMHNKGSLLFILLIVFILYSQNLCISWNVELSCLGHTVLSDVWWGLRAQEGCKPAQSPRVWCIAAVHRTTCLNSHSPHVFRRRNYETLAQSADCYTLSGTRPSTTGPPCWILDFTESSRGRRRARWWGARDNGHLSISTKSRDSHRCLLSSNAVHLTCAITWTLVLISTL